MQFASSELMSKRPPACPIQRWSRTTRCLNQPSEVWINKPREKPDPFLALTFSQAA
jgi:hypothetical protein